MLRVYSSLRSPWEDMLPQSHSPYLVVNEHQGMRWTQLRPWLIPQDKGDSDRESVDTLPARRPVSYTGCHDPSCCSVMSEMQAQIRRQGQTIDFIRKQLA
nr:unnamed protein product [Spirometra erinaceieuropaei]